MLLDLSPGQVFADDFKVQRSLSTGGMGAVYVVEQLSTGILRALKLMRAEFVQESRLRARFVQEARIGGRIASDHVVQVISAGIDTATQAPWLAMELLEGESLFDWAQGRRPSLAEIHEAVVQACHALGAAHALSIVHRDLKPENIFVARARRDGVPFTIKILDFGIAKVVRDGNPALTQAIGTPLWMAPEQAQTSSRIEPCTDVWALGLIVFWLLTGRYYWLSADHESTLALVREVLTEPLIPASARASDLGVATRLPPEFDSWFARAVTRDQARRFRTASEACAVLLKALDAFGSFAVSRTEGADTVPAATTTAAPRSSSQIDFAPTALGLPPTVLVPQVAATLAQDLPRAPVRKPVRRPPALIGAVAALLLSTLVVWALVSPSAPAPHALCRDGMLPEPDGQCPICEVGSHRVPGSGCVGDPCPSGLRRAASGCVCESGELPGSIGCAPAPPKESAALPSVVARAPASPSPRAEAKPSRGTLPDKPPAESTTEPAAIPAPVEPSAPKSLDRAEALAALARGEQNATRACAASDPTRRIGSVTVSFAPSGSVASVIVTGGLAGTREAACIENAFRAERVTPFSSPSVTFKKPIVLR